MEEIRKNSAEVYHLAIIGLGPKGLYGLERLLAQLYSKELELPVHIHVFNQNEFFGAGDIYRCDQPSYLIMNYANKNINIWSNELPDAIVKDTSDFTQWLSKKSGIPQNQLTNGFASRAMVGSYLTEGFTRLCAHLPKKVKVIPHINVVTDIEKRGDVYILKTKNEDFKLPKRFKKILLTTGHFWNGAKFKTSGRISPFIDFIYPTDKKLNHVASGLNVAIKGLGLTYIDAVLSLTEGRGGVFKHTSDGRYSYIRSGKEPEKIIPFSRTGIPMIPRNGVPDDKMQPYFLTEKTLKDLKFLSPIHFENNLLPLIKKEFLFNYYRILFSTRKRELLYHSDFEIILQQIDNFHKAFPSTTKFNWKTIENPFADSNGPTHEEILRYTTDLMKEADKGVYKSPLIGAVSSWRKLSALFNRIYSYGGLDAASHQLFDNYYFGFFNRIAYGPPIENVKKIVALTECGILDFNFVKKPTITSLKQNDSFRLQSFDEQKSISIDYLIDARIPKGTSKGKVSKLFSNLLKRGTLRYFENEDDITYTPGCLDLDYKGRPLDSHGKVNRDMTFYGTPTEGITFDNDTLSRSRNNFASQWAFDVALDINRIQERTNKKHERENELLPR